MSNKKAEFYAYWEFVEQIAKNVVFEFYYSKKWKSFPL